MSEEPKKETALVLKHKSAFEQLERVRTDALAIIDSTTEAEMVKTYGLACAVSQMELAMNDDLMKPIMALQGSRLGFRTDKDNAGGYAVPVVRKVVVEALLRGLRLTGNEINIIAGNLYATQEGLERLVSNLVDSGTPVSHKPSLVQVSGQRWELEYVLTFTKGGKLHTVERTFSGKWTQYSTDDQVTGKARRKALHEAYRMLTGMSLGEGNVDEINLQTMKRAERPDAISQANLDAFALEASAAEAAKREGDA
jgi:hypothetical protein